MELSRDDVTEILELLRHADFEDVEIRLGDTRIAVSRRRDGGGPPGAAEVTEPPAGPAGGVAPDAPGSADPLVAPPRATRAHGARAADAPFEGETSGSPVQEATASIVAPLVGTFYAAPDPDAPPFVVLGQEVSAGSTVGLIEVMKQFSAVTAGVTGRIRECLVANGDFVEYGQHLFTVDVGP